MQGSRPFPRWPVTLLALLLCTLLTSACNTVRGIGQDIKKGGEAIERAGNK